MSSEDPYAAIISEYSAFVVSNYCAITAIVLFLYDFVVTFTDEVSFFWRRKWTGATVLFFLVRYESLLSTLYNFIIGFIPCAGSDCLPMIRAGNCFTLGMYLFWAAFSGLRAYALSRKMFISCIVFALSIVPVVVNLVDVFGFYRLLCSPDSGCTVIDSIQPKLSHVFAITSRGSLIAADVLLISITWTMLGRRTKMSGKSTFARVILIDGAIYFICLFVLNVLHLSFTLSSITTQSSSLFTSNIVQFTNPLTSILVWRFMLDLQAINSREVQLDSKGDVQDEISSSGTDSLVFERVVGSLASFAAGDGGVDGQDWEGESGRDSESLRQGSDLPSGVTHTSAS